MSDKSYFEEGTGNEVTQQNMEKLGVFAIGTNGTLGTAATAAVTQTIIVPMKGRLVGVWASISADPGASTGIFTVKNAAGTVTYATVTHASGASALDSLGVDPTIAVDVDAGTVLELEKSATSTNACTGDMSLLFSRLEA